MSAFEAFPKIPRLRRECTITEKIDGTNAQIFVQPLDEDGAGKLALLDGEPFLVAAGSRTRYIVPGDDNFGFAAWVYANADELVKLGPGRHFGEWYGAGIQRRYGLTEKRFALFNTARWGDESVRPACCEVAPQLYVGRFTDDAVDYALGQLREYGSKAAPGFMQPEGIIVYMHASKTLHKVLIEGDDLPKGAQ